ncbi:hypothetical protein [Jannaschia rubra]|uniref:hypothetical protein n=1 Tax=Jannaschia rubra TaxID=282197 RepID=UPI0024914092|nr:hypothetical protein [Jannaschia rubra]
MSRDPLDMLGQLAGLRADRSAARLAKVQVLIDRLQGKLDALRDAAPGTPGSIAEAVMRDRWHRWRAGQIAELNLQIARLEGIAQPHREAHARDAARQAVLERLKKKARR